MFVSWFVRLKSNVGGWSQIHNFRDIKTKQHLKDRSVYYSAAIRARQRQWQSQVTLQRPTLL